MTRAALMTRARARMARTRVRSLGRGRRRGAVMRRSCGGEAGVEVVAEDEAQGPGGGEAGEEADEGGAGQLRRPLAGARAQDVAVDPRLGVDAGFVDEAADGAGVELVGVHGLTEALV